MKLLLRSNPLCYCEICEVSCFSPIRKGLEYSETQVCRLVFLILVPIILKKLPSTVAARFNDVKLLSCEVQQGNPLPVFQWQVQPNIYDVSKGTYGTAEWTSLSEVLRGKMKCYM